MYKWMLGWALLLAGAAPGMAAAGDAVPAAETADMILPVSGELGIDPQGNVFAIDIRTIVTPPLKDLIEKSVRQWKFEPVIHDGKPGYAKTSMQLALVATKVDNGYQLHIRDVRFYSTRQPATSMEPPRYPVDAARAGVMGNVLLAVRINAQGQVVDAMATQVAFPYRDMKPKQSAQWAKAFGKASIEAARKWQFTPANVEFGDVADATLILPVTFWLGESKSPINGWQELPTIIRTPIPWLAEAEQSFDPVGLRDGQSLALQSPVHLLTVVNGQAL